MHKARLAIHGGAGVIDRDQIGSDREQLYRQALARIAASAWQRLVAGASALDAAEHAVRLLEDCELFNAGYGAVLNRDGVAEMDAAIMDGRDKSCGAVAAVTVPRNPISLARCVMRDTEHVLLAGEGADRFAETADVVCEDPVYFVTEARKAQLAEAAREGRVSLDHDQKFGTVGAVARDANGHLAAATSTGGMTNKLPGRVGDSPVIGAGTWADDRSCAVSGTGHGEYFIRAMLGYDIDTRMRYGNQGLARAAEQALEEVARLGGSGGLVAVSRDGELELPFNSPGMYRAWVGEDGEVRVAIYSEED
jgi:L-asparaginase/beta-aspartyl-peptidase (threonine type)